MLNGDALLSFLALTGHGSWSTFERAVEDVTGNSFYAYSAARALCARGLLEFDWFGNRSWSVPPLTVVRLRPGRLLCVGVIDDGLSTSIQRNGFAIEPSPEQVTKEISYTRSEIFDLQRRGIGALDNLGPGFQLERQSLDAGPSLLGALPQLGSIIAARPLMTLDQAIGDGEVRFLDPHTFTFKDAVASQSELDLNFEVLRVKQQFAGPRYYYVDSSGARRVELELALTYLASRTRKGFLHYSNNVLAVDLAVHLPVLIERALYFSGARFAGSGHAFGRAYARFSEVPLLIARIVAMKLLTSLQDMPTPPVPISGDQA
jgi:hypothetical protein